MIIFLQNHPQKNEIIHTTDCMNLTKHRYQIDANGSQLIYSECWEKNIRRYWLRATDLDTGEKITCEYELIDT